MQDEFFLKIEQVLQHQGALIVLTDNLWYGRLLIRSISRISYKFVNSMKNVNIPSRKIIDQTFGYTLYEGYPDEECGHVCNTSSYFEKLKRKELSKKGIKGGYFIHLVKVVNMGKEI